MPRLAELHLGQGVGVEMLEGPEAGRQEVDLLIAACPSLTQVRQCLRKADVGCYWEATR